jgi:hypothetical protein
MWEAYTAVLMLTNSKDSFLKILLVTLISLCRDIKDIKLFTVVLSICLKPIAISFKEVVDPLYIQSMEQPH